METPPERIKNEAKLLIYSQLTRGSFLQTLYHIGPVCPAITARTDHYCGQWPQSSRNRNIKNVVRSSNVWQLFEACHDSRHGEEKLVVKLFSEGILSEDIAILTLIIIVWSHKI